MTAESANTPVAPLDEETQRLLNATTARLVNQAVERRVDSVVRTSAAQDRISRRLWPLALGVAVLVLATAIGWLLHGAGH